MPPKSLVAAIQAMGILLWMYGIILPHLFLIIAPIHPYFRFQPETKNDISYQSNATNTPSEDGSRLEYHSQQSEIANISSSSSSSSTLLSSPIPKPKQKQVKIMYKTVERQRIILRTELTPEQRQRIQQEVTSGTTDPSSPIENSFFATYHETLLQLRQDMDQSIQYIHQTTLDLQQKWEQLQKRYHLIWNSTTTSSTGTLPTASSSLSVPIRTQSDEVPFVNDVSQLLSILRSNHTSTTRKSKKQTIESRQQLFQQSIQEVERMNEAIRMGGDIPWTSMVQTFQSLWENLSSDVAVPKEEEEEEDEKEEDSHENDSVMNEKSSSLDVFATQDDLTQWIQSIEQAIQKGPIQDFLLSNSNSNDGTSHEDTTGIITPNPMESLSHSILQHTMEEYILEKLQDWYQHRQPSIDEEYTTRLLSMIHDHSDPNHDTKQEDHVQGKQACHSCTTTLEFERLLQDAFLFALYKDQDLQSTLVQSIQKIVQERFQKRDGQDQEDPRSMKEDVLRGEQQDDFTCPSHESNSPMQSDWMERKKEKYPYPSRRTSTASDQDTLASFIHTPLFPKFIQGLDSMVDAITGYNEYLDYIIDTIAGDEKDGTASFGKSIESMILRTLRSIPLPQQYVAWKEKSGILLYDQV